VGLRGGLLPAPPLSVLADGDPHRLAPVYGRLDEPHDAQQLPGGVEHVAPAAVHAGQYAAPGVARGVSRMNADALIARHPEQQGQPAAEARRAGDEHPVSACGNGGGACLLGGSDGLKRRAGGEAARGGLEGVAEVGTGRASPVRGLAHEVEMADGVVGPEIFAF
jgi:hypothetical protein